jgi:hypothetical protein
MRLLGALEEHLPPARRELHRVVHQVHQDLPHALGVAVVDQVVALAFGGQADAVRLRQRLDQRHGGVDGVHHLRRLGLHGELPRLHLGQVQHLVHEPQQVARAVPDAEHLLQLLRVQAAVDPQLQQLGVADHRVQRRAQLVAHGGQEVGLRLAGRLGLGPRHALAVQLHRAFGGAAPVGDIAQRHQPHALRVPLHLHDAQLRGDRGAAGPDDVDLAGVAGHGGEPEFRAHQPVHRPAEEVRRRGIRETDGSVAIEDDDAVGEMLDDLAEAVLVGPSAVRSPSPVGSPSTAADLLEIGVRVPHDGHN